VDVLELSGSRYFDIVDQSSVAVPFDACELIAEDKTVIQIFGHGPHWGRMLRAWQYRREEQRTLPGEERALAEHIEAVVDWLLRAQMATPDDGIAQSYNPLTYRWWPSYPETTGYIICSLLRAADSGFDAWGKIRDAARRMGHWLVTLQQDCGGFPGGVIGNTNGTAVLFNTGQILKGLTDLIDSGLDPTGEIATSASRAASYMVELLDDDGCWRKGRSTLTSAPIHAYDVRAAWALARYGRHLGDERAIEAAAANGRWVCSIQRADGWFEYMNFDDGVPPLTHTIAYTIQGLMELGAIVGNQEFIDRAEDAAQAIFALQEMETGAIPGQCAEGWRPVGDFTSNTGNAQMAIVAHRIATLTREESWRKKARLATGFCRRLQELDHPDPGRRGAVRGSYPSHVGYGRYWYMNWTQKFLLDALLCELGIEIT
jgi:hypothetical protein